MFLTRVDLKSRKYLLFLQTQPDYALKSLGIHKGFLRLFALNPACVCGISVIFFVFRYPLRCIPRKPLNTAMPPLPHHHRRQERRGRDLHQDGQGLAAHCPWCAQHCGGPALCDLPVCDRFERALESDCRTGRIFDRAAWLGARQRCFQRGIYQWCYCG